MKRPLLSLIGVLAVFSTAFALVPAGTDAMTVSVEFERTFNLFPQSPVRVRGVDVGIISSLETAPGSDTVRVNLRLEDGVDLPADAHAIIITSALLGERYVQLEGGSSAERLADGDVDPVERTIVPFEFDEVLEGLNDFVGGLDENEVARLITNLADLLEGNGAQLGTTLEAASGAIAALKENDEELLDLADALSELNESLVTRDGELAALLRDWVRVAQTLTSESTDLDGALDGLLVLTREVAELLIDHRVTLSDDVDTVTRVGRTLKRNLDRVSTTILGSAELFRHAHRVIDRDTNMLPLVNHNEELEGEIAESLEDRLVGLCLGANPEMTEEECAESIPAPGESGLCIPGVTLCAAGSQTVADVIIGAVQANPSIGAELLKQRAERRAAEPITPTPTPSEDQARIDDALRDLGLLPAADEGSDR